jgi:H+-transporting ATPase
MRACSMATRWRWISPRLTGESLPATRKPGEAVFSGSIVRQGEIGALVYATGSKTYFGKTAQLVETRTPSAIFKRRF